MNYRAFFENLQSRYHLEELLLYLHLHPEEFSTVFNLVFQTEEKIAWRVLWAVEKVSQRNPGWFDEQMVQQVTDMVMTTKHRGMHRIGLSILTNFPVPDPINVEMLNLLYDWMLSPKFSIGVQSLAMKLLYKYVQTNKDLLYEFMLVIEQADESEYTAAFVSSRRNILKTLSKQLR
jgi:hypothetical protein